MSINAIQMTGLGRLSPFTTGSNRPEADTPDRLNPQPIAAVRGVYETRGDSGFTLELGIVAPRFGSIIVIRIWVFVRSNRITRTR
jgi:hypothetical protein